MARKKSKRLVVASAEPEAGAGPSESHSAADSGATRSVLLALILVIFVVFEAAIYIFFKGGADIEWKRELVMIDSKFADGRTAEAAADLRAFGDKYPDAQKTFGWNEKMGRYHAAAGKWSDAAEFFRNAVALDPEKPGMNARAGEALWRAGKGDDAVAYLEAEITKISRATGDHDRANFCLGMMFAEDGQYSLAFQHFQAISDPKPWEKETAAVAAKVEAELVAPAKAKAAALAPADVLKLANKPPAAAK